MRFVEQKNGIEAVCVESDNALKGEKRHGPLLPDSIRALIIGPSGCGKTSAILSLVLSPRGLRLAHLMVYSKSLHQSKYRLLEEVFRDSGVSYRAFNNSEDVITPEDIENNTVVIFDDVSLEKQTPIKEFFALGRHKDLDCFYLAQSFSQVSKFLIRDNANLLLIFQQDLVNLKNIHRTHVNSDMSFETFQKMCRNCWQKKHDFLMIDKDSDIRHGRYRRGFNTFVLPSRGQSFWNDETRRESIERN